MSTSKPRKRIDDPRQPSILRELRERQTSQETTLGSMRCKDEIQEAIDQALKQCPLSRHQVAGEMSHLLNEGITKAQIDSWTAESKIERHIPAEFLPAFCEATDYDGPLIVMTRKRRLHTFQEPDALRSEIHRKKEEARQLLKEAEEGERLLKLLKAQGK